MKNIAGRGLVVLLLGAMVWGLWTMGSDNMKSSIEKQQAYDQMYAQLALKSPDHRNLVGYYQGCLSNFAPQRYSVDHSSPHCLQETSAWSKSLKLAVPFSVIEEDILVGEANVYVELQKR